MTRGLSPSAIYDALHGQGVDYYCGVPDSLLSPFIDYLDSQVITSHDIAVSEGHAVAIAIGYHVATGRLPLVYMQNSGLGNAVNPLISLADPEVMSVPMILLIGWRGRPGTIDEPQHKKQGNVTLSMLGALDIPTTVLSNDESTLRHQIRDSVQAAVQEKRPVALLVCEDVLDRAVMPDNSNNAKTTLLSREAVISMVADLPDDPLIVATTGKTGRELFEHREHNGQKHDNDLLVVGGMGHASAIAQAIAKYSNGHSVYVLDGDGAALMQLGAVAHNGVNGGTNFYHVLINNGTHESVGRQQTIAREVDLKAIAAASGYAWTVRVATKDELADALRKAREVKGACFIEALTTSGSRNNLSRPTITPATNKKDVMNFLRKLH